MPRSQAEHLTEAEIETLRQAFRAGTTAKQAALEVQCSERIAHKYFGFFSGNRSTRRPSAKDEPQRQPFDRERNWNARHYQSNFEPS